MMKKVKKYVNIILGSFLIGLAVNVFFKNFNVLPSGLFGLSLIYANFTKINLAVTLFLANIFFALLGYTILSKDHIKKLLIPSIIIPISIYISSIICKSINISEIDLLLITIFGSFLIGYGYKLIYREENYVSGLDLIINLSINKKGILVCYFIDILILLFVYINFGIESLMYSFIAITIIEVISKRGALGTSDTKIFYIITKEEEKVKKYIMEELHHGLTVFDVKGGFSNSKSKVLMSAIPTVEYYKIREHIKQIDPQAFISITDSYEVINAELNK